VDFLISEETDQRHAERYQQRSSDHKIARARLHSGIRQRGAGLRALMQIAIG
jgi:hypothetical protein